MKIAIFGKVFDKRCFMLVEKILKILKSHNCEISIYEPLAKFLQSNYKTHLIYSVFSKPFQKHNKPDILFSLGGDGTFLDATVFVGNLDILVSGINTGRLGFLANISETEVDEMLTKIINKQFSVEKRILLNAQISDRPLTGHPYCLNEISVQKINPDTMIAINVYMENQLINSFWADGIIISTPTGSTAYSLSAGGPIMLPEAENIIITPIAPHTLTVRPIVLPLSSSIRIEPKSRKGEFLCSVDSRTEIVAKSEFIDIKKADFKLQTILPHGKNFFDTIRNKLSWGIDKRN